MAITRTARGSITSKTSGTTLTIASQTVAARSLLVVYLAYDDQTLSSVTFAGTPMTLGDAVIGGGVRTRLAWLYVASGTTGTIVATWSAALVAKAMAADSFVSSQTTWLPNEDSNAANTGNGTAASTAATAAIVGGTESIRVGVVGTEGPSGDTAGTWVEPNTGGLRVGTTGNPAAGNVTVSAAYSLAPTAGSTTGLSKTGMTSRDWGAAIRSFYWALPITVVNGSFTADAVLKSTVNATFTANAVIYNPTISTYSTTFIPVEIVDIVNGAFVAGDVTLIDESPDSPDALALSPNDATVFWGVRIRFNSVGILSGTQTLRAYIRKNNIGSGGFSPANEASIFVNNVEAFHQDEAWFPNITNTGVYTATFTPDDIGTTDASTVTAYVELDRDGGPTNWSYWSLDAIEWQANLALGFTANAVIKTTQTPSWARTVNIHNVETYTSDVASTTHTISFDAMPGIDVLQVAIATTVNITGVTPSVGTLSVGTGTTLTNGIIVASGVNNTSNAANITSIIVTLASAAAATILVIGYESAGPIVANSISGQFSGGGTNVTVPAVVLDPGGVSMHVVGIINASTMSASGDSIELIPQLGSTTAGILYPLYKLNPHPSVGISASNTLTITPASAGRFYGFDLEGSSVTGFSADAILRTAFAYDDFNDVVADSWGSADIGGDWSYNDPGHAFSKSGTAGEFDFTGASAYRALLTDPSVVDQDVEAEFSNSVVSSYLANYLYGRLTATGDATHRVETGYAAALHFEANNSVGLSVVKFTAGSEADLDTNPGYVTVAAASSLVADEWWHVRLQVEGTDVRARAWKDGDAEPDTWHVEGVDNDFSTGGGTGINWYNGSGAVRTARMRNLRGYEIVSDTGAISGSFTANAVIKGTIASTFTSNAIIKVITTGTLTADAVIKRTLSATVTGDAVIKGTVSAAATADSVLKGTISATFTGNAVINNIVSATFAADARLLTVVSSTFTANATINTIIGSTFTADAVLLKTASQTFTADARIIMLTSATFTADAVILLATTGSATADAYIVSTISQTFTADALLLKVNAASITADAYIISISSTAFTADSVLLKTNDASLTADAIIKASTAQAFTADATILGFISESFTADSVLKATASGSWAADAVLQRTEDRTFTADAVVLSVGAATFTADARLLAIISSTVTANAVLLAAINATATADAYIIYVQTGSFAADAIILRDSVGDISADAVLQRSDGATFAADAILLLTEERTITGDAVLAATNEATFTADSYIIWVVSESFTSDAVLKSTVETAFTADAYLLVIGALIFTADAVVKATTSESFTGDGVFQRAETGSFTGDAVIQRVEEQSFVGDAVVKATLSSSATSDAVIQRVESATFTSNAVIAGAVSAAATADAVLRGSVAASFTADSVFLSTVDASFTGDARLLTANDRTFTADAYILIEGSQAFTADAVLQANVAQSAVADAIIQNTQESAFTADASLISVISQIVTADAVISKTNAIVFTANGIIKTTTELAFTADSVLVVILENTFTADAAIVGGTSGIFTADAVLKTVGTSYTFSAHALILPLVVNNRPPRMSAVRPPIILRPAVGIRMGNRPNGFRMKPRRQRG